MSSAPCPGGPRSPPRCPEGLPLSCFKAAPASPSVQKGCSHAGSPGHQHTRVLCEMQVSGSEPQVGRPSGSQALWGRRGPSLSPSRMWVGISSALQLLGGLSHVGRKQAQVGSGLSGDPARRPRARLITDIGAPGAGSRRALHPSHADARFLSERHAALPLVERLPACTMSGLLQRKPVSSFCPGSPREPQGPPLHCWAAALPSGALLCLPAVQSRVR